jgi:hypothetical protein
MTGNAMHLSILILNDQWVTKEMKEELKKFLDSHENENAIYQNLWDIAKTVLKVKFIVINVYIKKETSQINNLMVYLKILEKQEQTKPKTSRWREIIKIGAKINEIETKRTIQRINGTKNWFFEKLNMINKSLANMTKRREKTQINKIKDEKGDITTITSGIQRIIREYFEILYSSKLENLDEMDNAYNQPKLDQEDITHLNRLITSNEIETVAKSFSTRKAQHHMDSCLNFTKSLKKNYYQYS